MKNLFIICLFCFFSLILPDFGDEEHPSEVPSLTIGPIVSVAKSIWITGSDHRVSAQRGIAISELVQRYDCYVQTRWQGLNVVQEKDINALAYIDSLQVPVDCIQSADYFICAHFDEAQKGTTVTGNVFCVDLMADETLSPHVDRTGAENIFGFGKNFAETSAKILSLKPRGEDIGSMLTVSRNSVIVVCEPANMLKQRPEELSDFCLRAEASLHSDGFKKLADRSMLETLLKEKSFNVLGARNVSDVNPRMLAGISNADYLVMGQLSPWVNRAIRLDLYLVDASTGAILAAVNEVFRNSLEIPAVASSLILRLVHTPVPKVKKRPVSRELRMREARLLVSDQFWTPVGTKEGVFQSFVSGVEGAYVLARDDTDFMYKHVKRLRKSLYYRSDHYKSDDLLYRAGQLVNAILSDSSYERYDDALLLRAEALCYAGMYAEGISLLKQYEREHAGLNTFRLCLAGAFAGVKSENFDTAEYYIKKGKLADSPDFLARVFVGKFNNWKFRNIAKGTEVEEYQKYKALFLKKGSRPSADDCNRYLTLMRSVLGPEKALACKDIAPRKIKIYENARGGLPALGEQYVTLHKAYCNYELGNKLIAGRLCKDVIASFDIENAVFTRDWMYPPVNEAKALLAKIEAEIGPVDELWKTSCMIRPLKKGGYRIYIVHVGEEKQPTMKYFKSFLKEYYGDAVGFLDPLPVPKDAFPDNKDYVYDWNVIYRTALASVTVPDNAVMLLFITPHKLAARKTRFFAVIGDEKLYSAALFSYSECWYSEKDKISRLGAERFAFSVPNAFRHLYDYKDARRIYHSSDGGDCNNFPCLFFPSFRYSGSRFAMCPECQKVYLEADFDKINHELISYLKKEGVKVVKSDEDEIGM